MCSRGPRMSSIGSFCQEQEFRWGHNEPLNSKRRIGASLMASLTRKVSLPVGMDASQSRIGLEEALNLAEKILTEIAHCTESK